MPTSDDDYDLLYKIVLIGDSGAGKTSLVTRYVSDKFDASSISTIGVEYGAKTVSVNSKVVKAQIWDTAGQDRFRAIAKQYYRNAFGAIIVFDITQRMSFENVKRWLTEVRDVAPQDVVTMLVGNKADLKQHRAVSTEEARAFASQEQMNFMETSAKDSENVSVAFEKLVAEIMRRKLLAPPPTASSTDGTIPKLGTAVTLSEEDNDGRNRQCCLVQ
mmetsp:Transcript_3860/g.5868  ORF Transcript_3860/g.5868 Transcript_3860/m.5868 type:complete len:217 (+) Transcript_3860:157-807(+)|eukprot:CAMPEP_0184650416 /NCGR_PEP_ID=MMETSP0308-20130426/7939_1 /TAXON_ID=38269 /ORGANISM="Gloeochaete witrockiana, Strain SAG 46.84" /LENGTH=216 /DNA_ID=CAMNT_0027083921 /DNA_START=53 /DNA_END=703 /DNA_ORIENTATION=-